MCKLVPLFIIFVLCGCDPGRMKPSSDTLSGVPVPAVVVHRLNKLEYNNSVADLTGSALRPADNFAADAALGGFDNVAAGLTISPTLAAMYEDAARAIADDALDPRAATAFHHTVDPEHDRGYRLGLPLDIMFDFAAGGRATIAVRAAAFANRAPQPMMALSLDGQAMGSPIAVTAALGAPDIYRVDADIPAGLGHRLTVAFTNEQSNNPFDGSGSGMVVYGADVTSHALVAAPGRATVYVCDPADHATPDCWTRNVFAFAERAWRRPLTADDRRALLALWNAEAGSTPNDDAFKVVMRAVLLSNKFLFRTHSPRPGVPSSVGAPLDDYAIASRLSYFLWSSMPDAQLLADAAAGNLRFESGLRAEVSRMLASPKAQGLLDGFAAQWLNLRQVATAVPDPALFPAFNKQVAASMIEESKQVFADFLRNGRPVQDILTPGFTYANDTLAQYYGLPPPGSSQAARIDLPGGQRGGLLAQGAWLVATSMSTRTSPTKRGRWLLEQMLCRHVPEPPVVPPLPPTVSDGNVVRTMRERLSAHVSNPGCATCHNSLDPLGFGVEQFDASGIIRDTEAGRPIDASGSMPGGQRFNNAYEMATQLRDSGEFVPCLTHKLSQYALGRVMTPEDEAMLASIGRRLSAEGGSLHSLITLIVLSPQFRLVRTEGL